jgi:uncharacterized protein
MPCSPRRRPGCRRADLPMSALRQRMARLPVTMLIALVRAYRFLLSPWLGSSCRFEPTCSAYSLQALEMHGAAAGTYLTLARLVRCHPWCDGGHDPVPTHAVGLFKRGLSGAPRPDLAMPSPPLDKNSP